MKNKKKCVALCSSSKKSEIRHFHVVVMQWRQRNVQKKRDAPAKLVLFYCLNRFLFSAILVAVADVVASLK